MELSVFLVIIILVQVHTETCTTPNQEQAQCISLYKCTVLLKALVTQENEVLDFVRQSHCGNWTSDRRPLVCCGTQSTILKNITTTNESKISSSNAPLSDLKFCGYQHTDDYHYSGNITAIDEFPWLAIFKYQRYSDLEYNPYEEWYEFGCSGSLINERYVLTAAQCLRLRTSKVVAVRLGEYNIKHEVDCVKYSEIDDCNNPILDVGIEKRIQHPKYNRRSGTNDIGLIKLNRSITFTDYIRPICLPIAGTQFAQDGDIMTMTGFGRVDTHGNYADRKKKILVGLISNDECTKRFSVITNKTRHVTENIMCTEDLTTNNYERPCEGDSGGPLMYSYRTQWHIEGIAVWGIISCEVLFPLAYTRVANYLEWIESVVCK